MQVNPHKLEGITYVIQNWICAAICNKKEQQKNNIFAKIQFKKKLTLRSTFRDYSPPWLTTSRGDYSPTVLPGLLFTGLYDSSG